MTYPDPQVKTAIIERFVPLELDFMGDRQQVRSLNVFWTPTILFVDRRGVVHHESQSFLPPADFLDLLDIGEARTRMRWAEFDRAISLLGQVQERHPDGPQTPEAIYWQGIAAFLKSRSDATLNSYWEELMRRFPDSIWARRVP